MGHLKSQDFKAFTFSMLTVGEVVGGTVSSMHYYLVTDNCGDLVAKQEM